MPDQYFYTVGKFVTRFNNIIILPHYYYFYSLFQNLILFCPCGNGTFWKYLFFQFLRSLMTLFNMEHNKYIHNFVSPLLQIKIFQ